MDTDLSGLNALVCGASQGIGRAAAYAIAELGARVTVMARSRQALEQAAATCVERGASEAWPLVADMEQTEDLAQKVEAHAAATGPIHILVHNSGGPPPAPLLDSGLDAIEVALRRHLYSAHRLAQLLVPGMREAGFGRIITVTSTTVREPFPNLGVSNLTRAAMASWVKTLSNELPPGLTANNVCPGFTDTERLRSLGAFNAQAQGVSFEEVRAAWVASVPEGRLGRPAEIGQVIAFLATRAASYIRGVSMHVDGGRMHCI